MQQTASQTPIRRDRKWWKERWVADHYAHLKSRELLRAHINHKGYSIAKLAELASFHRIANGGEKVSRQMISLLVNDPTEINPKTGQPFKALNTCSPDLAAALEHALDVPDHMIFDVLPKSRDKRELNKAHAA
jgi:hypothetical protein